MFSKLDLLLKGSTYFMKTMLLFSQLCKHIFMNPDLSFRHFFVRYYIDCRAAFLHLLMLYCAFICILGYKIRLYNCILKITPNSYQCRPMLSEILRQNKYLAQISNVC